MIEERGEFCSVFIFSCVVWVGGEGSGRLKVKCLFIVVCLAGILGAEEIIELDEVVVVVDVVVGRERKSDLAEEVVVCDVDVDELFSCD